MSGIEVSLGIPGEPTYRFEGEGAMARAAATAQAFLDSGPVAAVDALWEDVLDQARGKSWRVIYKLRQPPDAL